MKRIHRETQRRVTSRSTLAANVALLGLFGALAAGAAQANDRSDASASCRQETKRVAVWPKGPKSSRMARFEERDVTVCDGKVASQRSTDATRQASDSGD